MTDPDELEEVLIVRDDFGVLVQGPDDAVEAVIAELLDGSDRSAVSRSRISPEEAAALGATAVALAATNGGDYLRLTADAAAKLEKYGPQTAGRVLRGYVRGPGGQFAGDLTFEPVSLAAEHALALQTAAISLALRSAIREVQKTVEEVADKVDDIRKHLRARLQGDVIGTYRHLREVAEQTTRRGQLLEADWDSVAGVRNQLHRDLDTLRGYVRGEVAEVTLDLSVPVREKRFRRFVADPGSVADVLRLILVTEQSLQLYEYLRLQRVRDRDPAHLESALEDARGSLLAQRDHDDQLVRLMLAAVDRTRMVEPLEVHHILSKDALDTQARNFHQQIVGFAESSRLNRPDDLGLMPRAGLGDTRAEVRRRATVAGQLGAGVARDGAERAQSMGRRAREAITRDRSDEP